MIRLVVAAIAVIMIAFAFPPVAHPGQKRDEKKDPFQSFEPKSKPGEGQKFLASFVGNWSVVKTFHPRKGEPVRVVGECKQTMIHSGRFLQSEFTFKAEAGPTTGLGLIGYEPETGLFTSIWTDSRQTRMSARQSEDKFDGERIVLFSKEFGGKDGRRSKTITRLEDEGRKIVHRQYSIEKGIPDRLVMELVLTRKSAK